MITDPGSGRRGCTARCRPRGLQGARLRSAPAPRPLTSDPLQSAYDCSPPRLLLEKHPNQAIVEAGGVGYDVTIPVSTYTHLPDAGARSPPAHPHPRPRGRPLALRLPHRRTKRALFEKLIGVSGIGPTLGVKILSGLAAPDLIAAIRRGEVERLVRIPGIGKKTAERMVLELRDKLPAPAGEESAPAAGGPFAGGSGRAFRSAQPGLRPSAGRSRRPQSQGRRRSPQDFEPLFRRALELAR